MLKQFFKRIYGDREGWIFVAYKDNRTDEKSFDHKKYQNNPQQIELMLNDIFSYNEKREYCIYFTPHLMESDQKGRVKSNSLETRCLWVDKDKGSISDLKPQPTYCWQTSEGRWQAVWILDKLVDIETAEALNKQLIEQVGGDKGGWFAGKLLRIPESTNYKYNPEHKGFWMWTDGPIHSPKDFAKPYMTEEERLIDEASHEEKKPRDVLSFSDALLKHGRRIPSTAWDILQNPPKSDKGWSEKLYDLEKILLKSGIPKKDVFAVAKGCSWNKYKREGRPDDHLWTEVCKAAHESPSEVPSDEEVEELPWVDLDSLMLYAERPEWLVEDIWMEKNVGWIAGEGKSYKSVLSLDLALSVASGTPFLGEYKVKGVGPVLMVQEEDPIWRVAHRIQTMAAHKNITGMEVSAKDDDLILNIKKTNVPLYVSCGGRLTFGDATKMDSLERAIDSVRPKMIILDPMFMMSIGIDEFKAGDITSVLNVLKNWRNTYECAIAVVHHYNKGQGSDIQKLYGSMALYAWSENSLLVRRESRDRNLISIRRDIKDSPSDDMLGVEFHDIDAEYRYELRDLSSETEMEEMASALTGLVSPDSYISLKDFTEQTQVTERTARTKLKELEKIGLVKIEKRGQGGRMYIQPTKKLLDDPELSMGLIE